MHCTTLIDGYNIIFTCGLYGKHATAESLAQARRRLLTEISERFGAQAKGVTVVFDAQRAPSAGAGQSQTEAGVNVFYSIQHANADQLIDELIGAHPEPQRLTVVSSDHWIQNAARRRRAKFMDSDCWYFGDCSPLEADKKTQESYGKASEQYDSLLSETEKKKLTLWAEQLKDDLQEDPKSEPGPAIPNELTPEDSQPFPQDYLDELQRQLRIHPDDRFD